MVEKYIPNGSYVYAYLRSKDSPNGSAGTPYYIGKGKGKRIYEKHGVSVPSDQTKILILQEGLTDKQAINLEIELIAKYGRLDAGTGILYNKTNGGDGSAGHIKTEDTIEKHRRKLKGRPSWTKDGKSVRSWDCPGPGWVRGNEQTGKLWWNNGIKEVWRHECPGPEWTRGRLPKIKDLLAKQASAAGKLAAKARWG